MPDAALPWSGDLGSGVTGDILLCSGAQLGEQRILRRLLTNPGDYFWQPDYGAGLGRYIGLTVDSAQIRAAIRSQIFLESCVARLPEPVINVENTLDGSVYVQIQYVDSLVGASQVLSFSIGGT
jgi:phage baseplate assembly protein W